MLSRKTKPQNHINFVASLLRQLGKEEGIKVEVEPSWEHVGKITRRDESVTYFKGSKFNLNGLGSTEIAVDKAYSAYFLNQAGYRVIPTKTFYSPEFCKIINSPDNPNAAYKYAKKIGWPIIIKPNSLSQGRLVCLVHNKHELTRAAKKISKLDRVFLVQPFIKGHDYRIVVLDNEVISAYERLPLSITGDGRSTVIQLLDKKQKFFWQLGRDTIINKHDFRFDLKLKKYHLNRTSVLPRGRSRALLDNCNLSTGGSSVDVTKQIHESFKNLAINITRDMGLRYCGVDLMVDKDIKQPLSASNNYRVIEINAAPGLDHYAEAGARQRKIVKEMYRKILRKLAK